MKILIWRNMKEIKKRKVQTIIFFVLPIIYFMFLYFNKININNIIAFYSLSFTLFSMLLHFSISSIIFNEQLLATTLSIKNIWKSNLIWIVFSGYIYSSIILLIGVLFILLMGTYINFNFEALFEYGINFFLALGFVGMSTCHYSDYSLFKQIIASFFAIISLMSPLLFLFIGFNNTFNSNLIIITVMLSIITLFLSYWIISKSNKEKLIINTSKMVYSYNDKIIEE